MLEKLLNDESEPGARQVPHFTFHSFGPKRTRHVVAVFVINEGTRLIAQLDRMQSIADQVDIVVADGGSSDGSTSEQVLAPRGVRALLVKNGAGRLSAQMRMAMSWALDAGYDGLVTIDGNNKDDPPAIPRFLDALNGGYDHVQGSRFLPGGKAINTPFLRHFAVQLLHAPLISLAAGFRYTDSTNGFRAYSRRLLLDPRVAPFRDVFVGYELHYYLAIRAARLGFRCLEVPVTRTYPATGPTPTKISPIHGNLLVLNTLLKACLHRFDPPDKDGGAGIDEAAGA